MQVESRIVPVPAHLLNQSSRHISPPFPQLIKHVGADLLARHHPCVEQEGCDLGCEFAAVDDDGGEADFGKGGGEAGYPAMTMYGQGGCNDTVTAQNDVEGKRVEWGGEVGKRRTRY